MKGIELSREFFLEFGLPMLRNEFPEYVERIAVGLVGHGSECFGFDDDISKDHDFDCGFCLWLTDDDYEKIGFKLSREYNRLPKEFKGCKNQASSALGGGFKGVKRISDFYSAYTGTAGAPSSWQQWLYTPAKYFAEAVNGEVFKDDLGEFTRIREEIKSGMPEDVRLKKIASKLVLTAQSGQYNFSRCLSHGDEAAAYLCLSRFAENYAELLHLLNKAYAPYHKWLLRSAENLEILGINVGDLRRLLTEKALENTEKISIVESLCADVINVLVESGVCSCRGNYLEPYAFQVNDKIKNGEIRNLHIIQE